MEADKRPEPERSEEEPVVAGVNGTAHLADGALPPVHTNGVNGHHRALPRLRLSTRRAGATAIADPLPPALASAPVMDTADEADFPRLVPGAYAAVVIERGDDLASVFGKIAAAASPRVALVARRGNRELSTQLGMRRLQRHLDLSGRDLILVTRSRSLRLRAREEGLPAVGSLKNVDFDRGPGLHLGWVTLRLPALGALLAVAIFTIAVALGVAVLLFYVPTATVTFSVPVETVGDAVDIVADTKVADVNVTKGIIPAHRREVTVSRTIPGPATGNIATPVETAIVGLTFSNKTARAINIPKGTVVSTANGVQFSTNSDVSLAARLGATADVQATATAPGSGGNVPANAANRLDAALAAVANVTNRNPGERGSDKNTRVVTEQDVNFIKEVALPYLIDQAKKELVAKLGGNETVFSDGARAEFVGECTSSPPIGQEARYVELVCTAKVSMISAVNEDLKEVGLNRFQPRIAENKAILEDGFKVTADQAGTHDETFDRLTVTTRMSFPVGPLIDREELRKALAGKTKDSVERETRLRVPGVSTPVQTDLSGWAPWLPKRENRIQINVVPVLPQAAAGQ